MSVTGIPLLLKSASDIAHTQTCAHKHTHTHTHTHRHAYTHTCMHTCMHALTCSQAHVQREREREMHTHTQMQPGAPNFKWLERPVNCRESPQDKPDTKTYNQNQQELVTGVCVCVCFVKLWTWTQYFAWDIIHIYIKNLSHLMTWYLLETMRGVQGGGAPLQEFRSKKVWTIDPWQSVIF